ncbi:WXG100 family type VII secretion target [Longispora sp. NPDC051575]|uniref:WXG100 family type VII secretion target n=1 Tax=Longispora sp. NPDC051575 TaxID=3154943 RepID=UPI00343D33BF
MSIQVSYEVLEHATGEIKKLSGQIDEKLDTLRQGLQRLQWDGNDREAYNQHQKKWDDAVKDLNSVLAQIGAAVGMAKQNYMDTEMQNSKLWNN